MDPRTALARLMDSPRSGPTGADGAADIGGKARNLLVPARGCTRGRALTDDRLGGRNAGRRGVRAVRALAAARQLGVGDLQLGQCGAQLLRQLDDSDARSDTGDDLRVVARLDHIVVGARLKPAETVAQLALGGEQDEVGRGLPEA